MSRLTAFLEALPFAPDDEFVSAPGLGVFRAKYVRRGLERGVIVEHRTGYGFALLQPTSHGVCKECAAHRGSECTHCACQMCAWFRQTEERSSLRVSRDRLLQLAARLRVFQFVGTPQGAVAALDSEI